MDKSVFVVDSFSALGTLFWIEVFQNQDNQLSDIEKNTITTRLHTEIQSFESAYSRFRADSTLSLLNKERVVSYDEELFDMVSISRIARERSEGVFDIFIKEKLEDKGYGVSFDGENHVHIKGETSEVKHEGSTLVLIGNKGIDLGGIGKGYLIDKLARIMRDVFGLKYFLINGGGDIFVTSRFGEEVELFLEHPTKSDEYLSSIKIQNKGFCSSSSFKRQWKHGDKEVNHFVSDKEVWAASYVIADTTVTADIFATVACILSLDQEKLKRVAESFSAEYLVINQEGDMYKSENFRLVEG
jgi:thiamine biosynthesis lipoprotein